MPSWERRRGPDEEVRKPIAVDIPRIVHREARVVTGRGPVQAKAVRAIGSIAQKVAGKGVSEDHVVHPEKRGRLGRQRRHR